MQNKLQVRSPFDQSLLAELSFQTAAELETCVQRGAALAASRRALAKSERITILEKLAVLLHSEAEPLALLIAQEGGKPLKDARVEAQRAVQSVKATIAALYQWHGQEIPMGLNAASQHRLAFTRREGRGLVLAISAFNHPLNLIVHQVVPALAVGCPVLIKPSSKTPLSCLRFLELLKTAGWPEPWCQMLLVDNAQTEKLASDPRLAAVSFIGSAKVGWKLRSQLAPGVHCMLEHGGTAPVIIMDDADLERCIEPLVRGAYYHAGQVCVSVQNIFVHEALMKDFCEVYRAAVLRLKLGDPLLPSTDVGPLISSTEAERVQEWIDEAISQGAEALLRGERWGANGLGPTILARAPTSCRFYAEEIFGPAVGLYPFTDLGAVIEQLNASPYAFQSAIFTKRLDAALEFAERVQAGSIMINEQTAFRVDWMPFGGQKHSGQGIGGMLPSMLELSHEKMIVLQSPHIN